MSDPENSQTRPKQKYAGGPGSVKGRPMAGGPGSRGAKKWHGGRIPANVGSLARAYTEEAIRVLSNIMRDEKQPGVTRVAAIKVLLDRGWGKPSEIHKIDVNGETNLLKVVNEIVHVHETREQIEFRDQTPLLELVPEDSEGNGSKQTH